MTCIVGLVHGQDVWIGGDSAGVAGLDLMVRADAKVFRNGPMLFGFTSSFRMGQLLRYSLKPPLPENGEDLSAFMATRFVDSVRACLKNGGFARKENEVESAGCFLVGFRGRLFAIEGDYQVAESTTGFYAVGCGAQLALGAMYGARGEPRRIVLHALRAAEAMSAGVRGPFVVRRVRP